MTNAAAKKEFTPRTDLNRTLVYRPHIRMGYFGLSWLSGILAVAYGGVFSIYQWNSGNPKQALVTLCLGFASALVLGILARYVLKPMAFAVYSLSPQRLKIERDHKVVDVNFQDLSSIQFSYIPYLEGWFKLLLKDGSSHKITVGLERSEYILEAVSSYNPDLISLKDLANYRRTAIASDHSWVRFNLKVKNWKSLVLRFGILPFACVALNYAASKLMGSNPTQNAFDLDALMRFHDINILIGVILWAVNDAIFISQSRNQLVEHPNNVIFNSELNQKLNRQFYLIHYSILIGIALILRF